MSLFVYLLLRCLGSVHYDEGESEAESMTSNMDMSNPIFQLYEAVRGARNSHGQLISEPFLQLPSRKDYPDYYHQISQPICLHHIKYGKNRASLTSCVHMCPQQPYKFNTQHCLCGFSNYNITRKESVLIFSPCFRISNTDLMFWLFFIFLYQSIKIESPVVKIEQ